MTKKDLPQIILNELSELEKPYPETPSWLIEKHGNTIIFSVNPRFAYIQSRCKKFSDKEINKISKEWLEVETGTRVTAVFAPLRSCNPWEFYVTVRKQDEKGCEIEVECFPVLYRQISQLGKKDVEEVEVQDAYITCERFLRTIFVGGLSGTIISEGKMAIPQPTIEFLINDPFSRQITEKLETLLENATTEVLIFGYMGTIFLDKLQQLKRKNVLIKLITGNIKGIRQDLMRKEKEKAMQELISIIGKTNISAKPEFHGRAIIVDNKAIVGSMDLDSYSLTGTRIEFAVYTEDPDIVRNLRKYFNQVFRPLKE